MYYTNNRKKRFSIENYDYIITSYNTVSKTVKMKLNTKNTTSFANNNIFNWKMLRVILDETHHIKNIHIRASRFCAHL